MKLEQIFNMNEAKLDDLIAKYKDKNKYNSKNEKRLVALILAYNNDDIDEEDEEYIVHKNFENIMDTKQPSTAQELRDLIKGKKNEKSKKKEYKETYSLTFGDRGENHAGMQVIGEWAQRGFNLKDLKKAQKWFKEKGIETELIHLNDLLSDDDIEFLKENGVKEVEDAYVLIARNGLSTICDPDDFYEEQKALEKDTQAYMRGKVVNKHARSNLCFDKKAQKADFENKKGTIVPWKNVPLLNKVRETIPEILGDSAELHIAEGNYYKNELLKKSDNGYIGFHGDAERLQVLCCRVGADMNLVYQWFFKSKVIGEKFETILHHGDIYIMSAKAVGNDWKLRNTPTLRHAAGPEQKLKYKDNWY